VTSANDRRAPPAAAKALLAAIDAACAVGAGIAAVAAALLALILITEVIVTSYFEWSQPWAVEYPVYLQSMVLFCGAGWTLRQGGHIRVGVLMQALPPGAMRLLDMLGSTFAIGVLGFATWALWQQWLRTVDFGSTSYYPMGTPLWIPQGLLTIGVTLLWLAFVARLLRLVLGQQADLASGLAGGGVE
jgi:TRAP-type C4-dicarboxylate transport system permease small subunit